MVVRSLQKQGDKLRAEAESERRLAARKSEDASGHESIGDAVKAEAEAREAEKLLQKAQELEQQAEQADADVVAALAIVSRLNHKEEELRKEYEHKLKDIDSERRRILS